MTNPRLEACRGFIRRNLINMLIILIAVGGVVLLAKYLPKKETATKPLPPKPVPVSVMTVELLPTMQDRVKIAGRSEPNRVVRISAEVASRIARYAHEGETYTTAEAIPPAPKTRKLDEGIAVVAGQPILYLNTDLAIAAVNQARADYKFSLIDYQRVDELRASGVSTAQELDQARNRRDRAKALLDRTTADMKRCVVLAPITGHLNRLPIEEGEYVKVGDPLAEIVDLSILKVVLDVSERDIVFLQRGQSLTITCGLVKPRTITGLVTYISDTVDERTLTTRVEVSIPNSDRRLRSGQIAKTYLPLRKLKNVVMVPFAAVIPLDEGHLVWITEEIDPLTIEVYIPPVPYMPLPSGSQKWIVKRYKAIPQKVTIDLDMIRGEHVRISTGLAGGEQLITAGHYYVGPNQPVTISTIEPLAPSTKN